MVELILKAARIAHEAHDGQFRKFIKAPYIVHPQRVVAKGYLIPDVPDFALASYWVHDVKEDCKAEFAARVLTECGQETYDLMCELTNPSKEHGDLNRSERKAMDRVHLAKCSYWAKVGKFLDRIDNINDLSAADRGFQDKYAAETMLLIEALRTNEDDDLIDALTDELKGAVTFMQTMSMRRTLRR